MSLMNQVLKDLERRRTREDEAGTVQAPNGGRPRGGLPGWWPWAVIAVVLGIVMFTVDRLWLADDEPDSGVVVAAPVTATVVTVAVPEPVPAALPAMQRAVVNTRDRRVQLEFEFDGAVSLRAFTLSGPHRLVMDFVGADPGQRKPLPVPSSQQALLDWVYSDAPDGSPRLTLLVNQRATVESQQPAPDFITVSLTLPPPEPTPEPEPEPEPAPVVTPSVVMERTLVTQSPRQRAEDAYSSAVRLLSEGRNADAEGKFREAMGHDATLVDARIALVNLLIAQGRVREAETLLQEGLRIAPGQPVLADRYARVLLDRGDLAGAIGVLSDSPPPLATHPEHHALLAALLQRAGHHESAATAYAALVAARDDQGIWWMGLGISLEALQRRPAALDAYHRAERDPRLSAEVARFIRQRIDALSLSTEARP